MGFCHKKKKTRNLEMHRSPFYKAGVVNCSLWHRYHPSWCVYTFMVYLCHSFQVCLSTPVNLIGRMWRKWWYVISEAAPQEALQLPVLPSWDSTLQAHSPLENERQGAQLTAGTNCPSVGRALPSNPANTSAGCSASTTKPKGTQPRNSPANLQNCGP